MEKSIREAPLDFRNYLYFANFVGGTYRERNKEDLELLQKAGQHLSSEVE